ncbi:MAG TPA: energy-dependent translational throttle protein EttA, partial [Burkholderiaceae bacterium]|nr:energy-dependent translational throttle protein EttA [Burkholderiaceae bacterium]
MGQYVFTMNRVGKIVPPKRQILRDISLSFFPGAKIGVLGLNGAGKSTLLKIMAGVDREIEGEAIPMPGIKIGYLPQEPALNPEHTVRQSVEEGLGELFSARARLDEVYAAYAEPDADFDALAAEQAELEAIIAAAASSGTDDIETQMEIAADALRLPPWDAVVGNLSGGEKRRVALCRLLLSKPDMLLLDEPTNHLDAESVEWLEQFLRKFSGTVVAVTHDRYFLDNAADWILELDRGHGIPWKGNYTSWLEQKEQRLKQEEAAESARQRTIKKELEWVRQNPKGRQAKAKARLSRFEELSSHEYQRRNETQEIFIPVAERLGNEVIEFRNVSKGYGDRLLIDDLSFKVPAGAIVGIIGPNGAGKSTLFRMISGQEQPDSGEISIGQTVQLAYVDQSREALPDDKSVFEAISNGSDILTVGRFEMPARAYIGRFNFRGSDQSKRVGDLSGGERGRLHLAKTLITGGNVLLLDEPSNDLDVETLRALEDALLEFAGCVMVISHDRWFLDRIATHILAFEGDSKVV